jgi:uncharacterized membrane protein YbhN (UPF0104 family)
MIKGRSAFQLLRYALLVVSVLILIYLVSQAGFRQIVLQLSSMHFGWLLLAFVFMAANFCFASLRYQCLINTELSFRHVLEVILASFLLNYASMIQGLGLGAKVGMLKARAVPISHSSAGIWLEISLDVLASSTIVMFFLGSALEPKLGSQLVFAVPLLFVVVASLAMAIVFYLPRVPEKLKNFLDALKGVASVSRIARALAYTAGNWLTAGAGLYFILRSLSPESPIEFALSVIAMASGFLTGLVSMVPGGIGVRELTWSYVVSLGGYPLQIAGLAAVLYRVLTITVVAATLSVMSIGKRPEND